MDGSQTGQEELSTNHARDRAQDGQSPEEAQEVRREDEALEEGQVRIEAGPARGLAGGLERGEAVAADDGGPPRRGQADHGKGDHRGAEQGPRTPPIEEAHQRQAVEREESELEVGGQRERREGAAQGESLNGRGGVQASDEAETGHRGHEPDRPGQPPTHDHPFVTAGDEREDDWGQQRQPPWPQERSCKDRDRHHGGEVGDKGQMRTSASDSTPVSLDTTATM